MTISPAQAEFNRQFAAEQSRQDRNHAVEYTKAALQGLILTSGVAITASITLVGTLRSPVLMQHMIPGLALFILAVASGVWSVQLFSQSKSNFGLYWEWRAMNVHAQDRDDYMREGREAKRRATRWLWMGFAFFSVGSFAVLGALWVTDVPAGAPSGVVTIQK